MPPKKKVAVGGPVGTSPPAGASPQEQVGSKEAQQRRQAEVEAAVAARVGRLNGAHRAGTIAWAKQSGYPWWPAMVTYDPLLGVFCRVGMHGQPEKYHVLFFGNVPQRAWIAAKALKLWEGPKGAGEELREQQTIPKKYQSEWPPALRFAEEAHRMPHLQRLGAFGWIEDLRHLTDDPQGEELQTEDPSSGRGKKRKRAKKDPKAPKRPRTNFLVFCQDQRAQLTSDNPTLKMTEIAAKLGELWREMPQEKRAKYEAAAAAEQEKYLQLMAEYTTPVEEPAIPPPSDPPPGSVTAAEPEKKKRTKAGPESDSPNEASCSVCEDGGHLLCCEGGCFRSFHLHCLGLTEMPTEAFVCDACESGVETCLSCHQLGAKAEMLTCSHATCGKAFHKQCARELPRSDQDVKQEGFVCPRHRCANSGLPSTSNSALLYCSRCPIAYHSRMVPAGCARHAAGSIILCPKHFDVAAGQKPPTVSACVVCNAGGELLCCDTCPACYHGECIEGKQGWVPVSDDKKLWRCPDCVNGTKATPLDVVWAKLGNHRWWPAVCRNKEDWPPELEAEPPLAGEFALQFLGTDEWAWGSHINIVKWERGDEKSRFNTGGAKPEFKQAVADAVAAHATRLAASAAWTDEQNGFIYANAKPPQYRKIRTNLYTFPQPWLKAERAKIAPCMCTPEDPCDGSCLNKMILTECDPKTCPVGKLCQNNRFQARRGPKVKEFPTPGRGFGLKNGPESIAEGDFVLEYCGEVVTSEECARRMEADGREGEGAFYMLALEGDAIIDARPAANLARFANHSCDPNMEMKKWNVLGQTRAGLFAIKPIAPGEELTWNYQLDSFEGHAKMECKCGSSNCSGWIGLKPKKEEEPSPPGGKKRKKRKQQQQQKKSSDANEQSPPKPLEEEAAALDTTASAEAASGDMAVPDAPDHVDSVENAVDAAKAEAAHKEKRKPKYLRRVANNPAVGDQPLSSSSTNADDAQEDDEMMDGLSTVSQPLVGADIQLHNFGEPLPNVWAMKATGEWEAYEAKRAEQQRIRDEWAEKERLRQEKWKELALKKVRTFFAEQNAFGCRRGCWERGLTDSGDEAAMRARIMNYEGGNTQVDLMEEGYRHAKAKKIKLTWSKAGLNNALKACKERRIWPGGHLPELRSRLTRYDTGEPLGVDELREPESEEEETSEEELDSEEEAELERQRQARKVELARWKALTPEQQAAEKKAKEQKAKEEKKRQLLELKETQKKLRAAPPEACEVATGTNDPRELVASSSTAGPPADNAEDAARDATAANKVFPAVMLEGWRLTGVSAGETDKKPKNPKTVALALPTHDELRSWVLEAQHAFWEARWKYWESVKLPKCQRACLVRNLVNIGETFDVRLRLVLYDYGGCGPSQLELDDLQEPLRGQVKKERRDERKRREAEEEAAKAALKRAKAMEQNAKRKAIDERYKMDIPEFEAGTINMLDNSGALLPAAINRSGGALPTPLELRSWDADSQRAFWSRRFAFWEKKNLNQCFKACKKSGLWQGGDLRDLRKRLTKNEFAPESLLVTEHAVFYDLAGKFIELEYETWWLGFVVQVAGDQILVEWSNGEAEWVGDLHWGELRIIDGEPAAEAVVDLHVNQFLSTLEEKLLVEEQKEKERQAEKERQVQAKRQREAAARQRKQQERERQRQQKVGE